MCAVCACCGNRYVGFHRVRTFAQRRAESRIVSHAANAAAAASPAPDPPKADAQMQAVLDELMALGGKPIETLALAQARKQPTPADAVKRLLKKQGKPTIPELVAKVEGLESAFGR